MSRESELSANQRERLDSHERAEKVVRSSIIKVSRSATIADRSRTRGCLVNPKLGSPTLLDGCLAVGRLAAERTRYDGVTSIVGHVAAPLGEI
jgi:hypothetical protein